MDGLHHSGIAGENNMFSLLLGSGQGLLSHGWTLPTRPPRLPQQHAPLCSGQAKKGKFLSCQKHNFDKYEGISHNKRDWLGIQTQ